MPSGTKQQQGVLNPYGRAAAPDEPLITARPPRPAAGCGAEGQPVCSGVDLDGASSKHRMHCSTCSLY